VPYKSEAQRRYLWAKHPEVARKFAKHGVTSRKRQKATHSKMKKRSK